MAEMTRKSLEIEKECRRKTEQNKVKTKDDYFEKKVNN